MRNRHRGGVIESHSDTIHDKNYTEVSNKKKDQFYPLELQR